MPRILEPTSEAIHEAAERLRAGGVVAFPTETVYGLGGDLFNVSTLFDIYDLKGRPANNPLIAHVRSVVEARSVVDEWDARCQALAARFWPGPLTLVLSQDNRVPKNATARRKTIALRSPNHPVAQALLKGFGFPIAAPSANRSGRVSPTCAEHVAAEFADVDDLIILDGGPCDLGIESTVLDLTTDPPRILRPGSVTIEMLRPILPGVEMASITSQDASPGTTIRHYAPTTPVRLCDFGAAIAPSGRAAALLFDEDPKRTAGVEPPPVVLAMPPEPEAYAARLYGALREADAIGVQEIIVEKPPSTEGLWASILDRLGRAAAGSR